jgi:hypothetical protein
MPTAKQATSLVSACSKVQQAVRHSAKRVSLSTTTGFGTFSNEAHALNAVFVPVIMELACNITHPGVLEVSRPHHTPLGARQ